MEIFHDFRRYLAKPKIRPFALAAPILVLLICLPLLRPIRHPMWQQISDDEMARLATIQSIAEQQTLAIDRTLFIPTHQAIRSRNHLYSDQPPMMSALLAAPYALMHRMGLTLGKNLTLVTYLLTVLGVTLPVAGAAGLIYRMGRLFELSRAKRAMLAAAVILGSGLISYGVVLNSHAPAAALVLASAASLVHITISRRPRQTKGWLAIAGFCAMLAATIEPAAIVFVPLFALVILAMRWRLSSRFAGLLLYAFGILPPLALHAMLTVPITGNLLPGSMHPELSSGIATPVALDIDAEDAAMDSSKVGSLVIGISRLWDGLAGDHGLLSHFPILIVAGLGVSAVMRRHWPTASKMLAGASVIGAAIIFFTLCLEKPGGAGSMFAGRWFIVFLPLLLFWAGAWLRKAHHPAMWGIVGLLLIFSVGVSLVGATDPFPRSGYDRYSAGAATRNLIHPDAAQQIPPILARQ